MTRFGKISLAALVTVALALGCTWLSRTIAADTCLDAGGAWFSDIGCQKQLPKIDRLIVDKSDRKLIALENGKIVRTMAISLGRDPIGPKVQVGDNKTPEGIYPIVAHKFNSSFYRALRLGYPLPEQMAAAHKAGFDPGGDIMIHGLPNGLGWLGKMQLKGDWTHGCIALTDDQIGWLYQSVADGTLVDIRA